MAFSPIGAIVVWTLVLWLLGWLSLPVSRRVFVALPDGGLAAGRLGFLVLISLLAFWGASLHLVPLRLAPALALLAVLAGASGWRDANLRGWVRQNWKSLLVSDAIFLLSWLLFLGVRLLHPEINDLEKPMDAALLSAAWKTDWLPFAHPWFSGETFTNYYYFGPLMGALMARALGAAPQFAYNLVQPAFCAFFLSITWALGAALTRSKWGGVLVMLLVGLSGPLEPLRQIASTGKWWPLDWFATSRVIENTINEYPAFTLTIGDAHAHFYALSVAALWMSLAFGLFAPNAPRRLIIGVSGLILGAWLMLNTWDAPVFGALLGLSIWFSRPDTEAAQRELPLQLLAPFSLAVLAALPFLYRLKPPVSGAVFDPWWPDAFSFVLLWGGWMALGALALFLPAAESASSARARFRRLLMGAGALALVIPFVFYIRGVFGGDLRHQDTVFKFGLQAWLLLGVGISTELGARLIAAWRARKTRVWAPVVGALVALLPLLLLAPATVIWTRAITQGTAQNAGVSLDGIRFLPDADQKAIAWLQRNGRAGEVVMEGVKIENGNPTGDYDANWGRVGAFSGLSSTLGWPQHVWVWGLNSAVAQISQGQTRNDYGLVQKRGALIGQLYARASPLQVARGASELDARYIFFGAQEGPRTAPSEDEARAAGFAVHEFAGDDGSRALILERIGR